MEEWRNKEDVSTVYFSKFPMAYNEEDMWQVFQKYGKVWEVYIAKRRNSSEHQFGFVRFRGAQNEKELRSLMDNIHIRNIKLNVNIPKHNKQKRLVELGKQNFHGAYKNGANWRG